MILFGTNELQKVMFLAFGFHIYLLPLFVKSLEEVDNVYLQTGYNLGANKFQVLNNILLPIALPNIFDAMRLGFGIGWGYIILAEMVDMGEAGVGTLILTSQRRGPREDIYLVLIAIVYGLSHHRQNLGQSRATAVPIQEPEKMSNQPQKSYYSEKLLVNVRFGDEPDVPQIADRTKAQNQVPAKASKADSDEQSGNQLLHRPDLSATKSWPGRNLQQLSPKQKSFPFPGAMAPVSDEHKPTTAVLEPGDRPAKPVAQGEQHVSIEESLTPASPAAASTICTSPNIRRLSLSAMSPKFSTRAHLTNSWP